MADNDLTEIEERFERLSFEVKLRVLERLIHQLRHSFIDLSAFEQSVRDMAADPAVQRELSGRDQQP
ncbi:MAG TPA: hypothetical protein VN688_03560 [Gemmataceae bacterium]|nr:hypothetical protein [Gemmataceae bacterium]